MTYRSTGQARDGSSMVDPRVREGVEKMVGLYHRRIITRNEAVNRLLRDLAPENMVELMALLPEELHDAVKEWADNAPTADEGWDSVRVFWIGPGPDEDGRTRERAALRRTAEGLRSFFGCNR
jgi:hypothetical protein